MFAELEGERLVDGFAAECAVIFFGEDAGSELAAPVSVGVGWACVHVGPPLCGVWPRVGLVGAWLLEMPPGVALPPPCVALTPPVLRGGGQTGDTPACCCMPGCLARGGVSGTPWCR